MIIDNNFPYIDEYVELIPDLVFINNIKGEYTHFNKIFLDFIKKNRTDVLNKTDFELFDTLNAEKFNKIDQDIITEGKIRRYEESFLKENGEYSFFNTSKETIYNNKNEKLGLFCIARNITEKKQYEIIYEDNEKLLSSLAIERKLETILLSIIFLAEKRSPKILCSILLLDEEKKHLSKGFAPSLPAFYNEAIEGVEIGEKIGSCGAAAYKKERVIVEDINSHENWAAFLELTQKANLHACWSEPILSSNKEILGTFAIYNNSPKAPSSFELKLISSYANLASIAIEKELTYRALEKTNKQLGESEILLKNILATIPDMLWLKDKEGVYLACNPEFELFFGKKENQIIGKTDYDFVKKELADSFRFHDKRAMNSQEALINEEWITYFKSNKTVLLETTKKALFNDKGEVAGVLGIGHDITNRKEQDDIILQQSKMASMGEMIGNIAHQWRQPLSIVSTCATGLMLRQETDMLSKEIIVEYCNIINNNAQYLSKTIDDFRNFSSSRREKSNFNFSENIKTFLNLISSLNIEHKIEIITNLDDSIMYYGSANELIQCYMNLFSNAKDAFSSCKNQKYLFITTYLEDNRIHITFKDNGKGFQESIIKRVFEPYFTTKHQLQGTGIGLSMTYNLIVEGMMGSIRASNEEYKYKEKTLSGAQIHISIPL